ncbi:MAG: 23S rRNA (uracil(1939)-C(5))-methyltransferase RlmD [Ruminococcus sp.]|nr:23S rRNA (uracil(1939)-C(5))-methyltransferase RlmD [Ruminococcus sp.]
MNRKKTAVRPGGQRVCRAFKRCGGCQLSESYEQQVERKQAKAERMLSKFTKVRPMLTMDDPYNYRCKVQNVYGTDRSGRIISGVYQSSGQKLTAVEDCMLEDRRAQAIVADIRKLMRPLKIAPYDNRTGQGILRHTLIRTSPSTGQVMLVMVTPGAMFPAKKNFIRAMTEKHPELTTIVQNVCRDPMPLTLGDRDIVMHGPGFIEDLLCGCRFRISPQSFYQVNPKMTGKLYETALSAAGIGQGIRVLDAYCGTGTIGIICAKRGAKVEGVELDPSACRDAVANAKLNGLENVRFCCADAGEFMRQQAQEGSRFDVLILDPPRAGASPEFIKSAGICGPDRIVYISCKIESLERDIRLFARQGYRAVYLQPVDMFPHTMGIETVCLMERRER